MKHYSYLDFSLGANTPQQAFRQQSPSNNFSYIKWFQTLTSSSMRELYISPFLSHLQLKERATKKGEVYSVSS